LAGEEETLSAIPEMLKERIELVEGSIEEAPHPFIYRILMEEGTKHVIEEYIRRRSAIKARKASEEEMASFLQVKKVDKGLVKELARKFESGELTVVGVDAGVNCLNLEVAYVPLCCAVAALCTAFDVVDHIPKAMTGLEARHHNI